MSGAVEVVHNKKYIEDIELDKAKWVEVDGVRVKYLSFAGYEHFNFSLSFVTELKKIIKDYDFSALGVSLDSVRVKHSNFKLPPEKPAGKLLSGDASAQSKELVRLLREESKVI